MRTKILALSGSGEFTPKMQSVDSYVLSLIDGTKKKVAILPTAAGLEPDYDKWIIQGVAHFNNIGFEAIGIRIIDRDTANNRGLVDQLLSMNLIYLSGGDPGHLLSTINNSYLEQILCRQYENGVIIAGSSAGAMIMGKHVLTNVYKMLEGEDTPVWQEGLGFIKRTIIPHYDYALKEKKELLAKIFSRTPEAIKNNLIGIDEDTALLITDDKDAMVLGQGNLHIDVTGQEKLYHTGSAFVLA